MIIYVVMNYWCDCINANNIGENLVSCCVDICIIIESYVHAYMTDGDGYFTYLNGDDFGDDYDVLSASWVTA